MVNLRKGEYQCGLYGSEGSLCLGLNLKHKEHLGEQKLEWRAFLG